MRKGVIAGLIALGLAGCASTPVDMTKMHPLFEADSNKSVQEYAACLSPKLGELWPFTQSLPIPGGLRLTADGSMMIPKTMAAVDVVASGDGSHISYHQKKTRNPTDTEVAARSCI